MLCWSVTGILCGCACAPDFVIGVELLPEVASVVLACRSVPDFGGEWSVVCVDDGWTVARDTVRGCVSALATAYDLAESGCSYSDGELSRVAGIVGSWLPGSLGVVVSDGEVSFGIIGTRSMCGSVVVVPVADVFICISAVGG